MGLLSDEKLKTGGVLKTGIENQRGRVRKKHVGGGGVYRGRGVCGHILGKQGGEEGGSLYLSLTYMGEKASYLESGRGEG